MTSPSSPPDHRTTDISEDEEDVEINVDSGHEDEEDVDSLVDSCSPTPPAALNFSISRLLGQEDERRPLASDLTTGGGVIRVPAQRFPLPPVGSANGHHPMAPFPHWLVHPAAVIHNSAAAAAAAAFASHAIKERLSGNLVSFSRRINF